MGSPFHHTTPTLPRVHYVAQHLRPADCAELQAKHGLLSLEGRIFRILQSVCASEVCACAELDGQPVAIWGIAPVSDDIGVVWLLGTPGLTRKVKAFVAEFRRCLRCALQTWPTLTNEVHRDNRPAIAMLKRLGAEFCDPGEAGFRRFTLRRTSHV